jgi:hypothetical protein
MLFDFAQQPYGERTQHIVQSTDPAVEYLAIEFVAPPSVRQFDHGLMPSFL